METSNKQKMENMDLRVSLKTLSTWVINKKNKCSVSLLFVLCKSDKDIQGKKDYFQEKWLLSESFSDFFIWTFLGSNNQ